MKNQVDAKVSPQGIGFCGLLTILFIGLKLTNHIAWSWLWVLSPLWIPIGAIIGILALAIILIIIGSIIKGLLEK